MPIRGPVSLHRQYGGYRISRQHLTLILIGAAYFSTSIIIVLRNRCLSPALRVVQHMRGLLQNFIGRSFD